MIVYRVVAQRPTITRQGIMRKTYSTNPDADRMRRVRSKRKAEEDSVTDEEARQKIHDEKKRKAQATRVYNFERNLSRDFRVAIGTTFLEDPHLFPGANIELIYKSSLDKLTDKKKKEAFSRFFYENIKFKCQEDVSEPPPQELYIDCEPRAEDNLRSCRQDVSPFRVQNGLGISDETKDEAEGGFGGNFASMGLEDDRDEIGSLLGDTGLDYLLEPSPFIVDDHKGHNIEEISSSTFSRQLLEMSRQPYEAFDKLRSEVKFALSMEGPGYCKVRKADIAKIWEKLDMSTLFDSFFSGYDYIVDEMYSWTTTVSCGYKDKNGETFTNMGGNRENGGQRMKKSLVEGKVHDVFSAIISFLLYDIGRTKFIKILTIVKPNGVSSGMLHSDCKLGSNSEQYRADMWTGEKGPSNCSVWIPLRSDTLGMYVY
jgi:hypothetical protein